MADKRISQLVERTDIANNDVVPIVASGATTTNKATISSIQEFMQENLDLGVTSVGITLGTTGTDVSVSGSPITTSGNITINLPTASATNRGLLSSADWTTFNNKQAAGSYVTLNTAQTITAQKVFTTSGNSDTMIISHGSGSGFALDVIKAGNGEAVSVQKTSGSGNAMSVLGGLLSTEGISSTAPANGISLLLNGRSADNVGLIAFGANTGGGQYNFIQASPTSLIVASRENTPLEFHTNVNGGGGSRMTIAGTGAVTLTGALNGVNASFTSTISSQDRIQTDTIFSVKHNSTIFTLNGYNSIQGNINSFAVYNGTKGMRINFPSNESFTHTLPDASGTLALTTDLGAYLPLTGGTLTGALNGTSAAFSGYITGAGNNPGGLGGSRYVLDWVSGQMRLFSYGANSSTNGGFLFNSQRSDGTNSINYLDIASTGAATFSSSVGVGGAAIGLTGINLPNQNYLAWYVSGTSGSQNVAIRGNGENLELSSGGGLTMTMDSSQRVGIGTASPAVKFEVAGSGALSYFRNPSASAATTFITVINANNTSNGLVMAHISDGTGYFGTQNSADLRLVTGDTERMRITSGGDVLVGATSFPASERMIIQKTEAAPLGIDRRGSDGGILRFYQDGTEEGNVTVSGTTVSYNGGHLSRYTQTESNEKIDGIVKGTVMSNLDQMAVWINHETGEPYENEQLNCMKISDVEGDKNVAGIFVNWDNDDQLFTNDMNIAMTGDMIIRIAEGVIVEKGDLLISAGDGTAKPQSDDLIRSNTIAKVTSNHVTCVYEDGSYCVPCVLMAC